MSITQQVIELRIKSIAPYGKGWQVNAFVNGVESEMTYYHETKTRARELAIKRIQTDGRLPHEPYRP
jgi:hypothetical protein